MREFKFRVVHKYAKGMADWETIKSMQMKHFENSDFTFMQYVGFKDINGQEMYEGDIVKGYWWENGNKHRHIGVVTSVGSTFFVKGVKQYKGFNDNYVNPTYEIIGNMYENPELL